MFKLTIEDDEGKTTVVPLARDEITIGRLEGNTIRLTERNVSRRHARLVRQNGALYIEDLASFTGVRVNGTKIATATPLREGDEVQIGDYRIALRGERVTAALSGSAIGDRPTMPNIPTVNAPMGTVGGSVAIPTRASVAAMAAQPAAIASPLPGSIPAVPTEVVPVDTAPLSIGTSPESTPAPEPVLTPPGSPAVPIPPQGQPSAGRRSPPQPQSLAAAAAQPLAAPPPQPPSRPQQAAAPKAQASAAARPAAAAQPIDQTLPTLSVPAVSEAQPTIPIRALGESVPDRTAGTAPARMFVLTTDLAGMEFQLDRASLVIGRTDENDIVLGHRSISRHHAKVVRDGDHYTIVDLQSANGVRVNGEDYERIELNPGDIVELGHVKLRFVGPLETFVFKPQSRGLTMPARIAIGAGAGLLGVVAVVAMLTRRHDPAEAPVAAAAPAPAPLQRRPRLRSRPLPRRPRRIPCRPSARPRSSPRPSRRRARRTGRSRARPWTSWAATIDDPALRRDAAIAPSPHRHRAPGRGPVRSVRRGVVVEELLRGDGCATSRFRRTASTSAAPSRATTRHGRCSWRSTWPPPTRRGPPGVARR